MIFVSLVTCLLGIGLFVLDLTTDVQFSLNMFKLSCSCSTISEAQDYKATGWIALYHCIQPFIIIITFLVFLSMRCCKRGKCSVPVEPKYQRDMKWWCINSVLCCLPNLAYIGSFVPFPAFTNLYRFYLDVKCHHARSKPDFRTQIVSIEKEIREHESLGELWKIQKIFPCHFCFQFIYNIF